MSFFSLRLPADRWTDRELFWVGSEKLGENIGGRLHVGLVRFLGCLRFVCSSLTGWQLQRISNPAPPTNHLYGNTPAIH